MKIFKKTLPNGLRVVVAPIPDNPTVTVLVLVEAGSKYEVKKDNGISHFLEHMCFKGTEKRPGSVDISRELDSIGSSYNAFTSHEFTGYYAKADSRNFKKIFDIVSDIYLRSTLPAAEIIKEKGVILEEINMYRDLPPKHIDDLFMQLLYGDTPAGRNILGEKKNILRMTRQDLVGYRARHYLPEATVIAIAGNVRREDAFKQAEKIFGEVPRGRKGGKPRVRDAQKKPAALLEYKKTDQAHFMLGVRTYDIFDKRNTALSVLAGVLSGGMSSRLFLKLREEMGAAYYVRADNETFTDHGFFQISAGVDKKRVREAIAAVLAECSRLAEEEISKEELARVKEVLIGGMKFSLESTDDIANFCGGQEILKREIRTAEEKAEKIRKITARELRSAAAGIFKDQNLNLALIGPFRRKAEFSKMLEF